MTATQTHSSLSTDGMGAGLFAGGIPFALSLALWDTFGFESLLAAFSTEPLYVIYLASGMVTVGFVPGLLYARRHTIAPLITVGVLFLVTGFGTWQTARTGVTPVGPTPFGWYGLLWVGVVTVTATIGWLEAKIQSSR